MIRQIPNLWGFIKVCFLLKLHVHCELAGYLFSVPATQDPGSISVFTSIVVIGKENLTNHEKSPKMSTQMWYMSIPLTLLLSKQAMWSVWIVDVWSYPVLRRMEIFWKAPVTIIFQTAFSLGVPFLVGSWLNDSQLFVGKKPIRKSGMWALLLGEDGDLVLSASSFWWIDYILGVKQLIPGVKQFCHVQY